jgi:hypothetical protein
MPLPFGEGVNYVDPPPGGRNGIAPGEMGMGVRGLGGEPVVVDFVLERVPRRRIASILRIGPWKEDHLREEFGELLRWATKSAVPTGRWIFLDLGAHRWEAGLEIHGDARPTGRVRRRTLPGTWVARVRFDPDRLAPRLVYHGLREWTRARRRDGTIRSVGSVREVYPGDPWKDPSAWASCEVQFVVRR